MCISFANVEKYLNDNEIRITSAKDKIVNTFKSKKNSGELKIHSCVGRVKDAESIYLKVKRKQKGSLEEIYDYAGVRVLCLCEQDVFDAHRYIVESLVAGDGAESELVELTAFNWKEKKYFDITDDFQFDFINKKYKGVFEAKNKRSNEGYKSLHYLVLVNDVYVEIQLRTVIQNVWAELGHSLAYKDGKAGRHVMQDFRAIADHLEAIDSVISGVRDTKDKEFSLTKEYMKRQGPVQVFLHDNCALHTDYRKGDYEAYENHLDKRKSIDRSDISEWVEEGIGLFDKVRKPVPSADVSSTFWVKCEDAYWKFCQGKHDEASKKYDEVYDNAEFSNETFFKEMAYLIQYRLGEIYFLEGKVKDAFTAFDECERLMPKDCKEQHLNIYKVLNLLAYHYWRLGRFYSKQSLDYMGEAKKYSGNYTPVQNVNYENSRTWYLLELYLNENNKVEHDESVASDYRTQLEMSYNDLKKLVGGLDKSGQNTNMFHTLACTSFEIYKSFGYEKRLANKHYIEDAYKYCNNCLDTDNGNAAFHLDHSIMLQRESLQDILKDYAAL